MPPSNRFVAAWPMRFSVLVRSALLKIFATNFCCGALLPNQMPSQNHETIIKHLRDGGHNGGRDSLR